MPAGRSRARPSVTRRLVTGLLAGALLAAGCTDGEPAPPAPSAEETESPTTSPVAVGDRVAVVVAPTSVIGAAEAAALEAAAERLALDPPEGLAEVRVVRAADRQFTADLVDLFAGDGYAVVCVVGTGAAELAIAAARRHGDVRVCATDPAVEGGPANLVAVAVDPAGLVTAAAAATSPAPAPVGLVVSPSVGTLDALEPLMTSLLPEPPPPPPPPSPTPAPSPTAAAPTDGATSSPTPAPSPSPPPVVEAVVGATTADGVASALDAVVVAGATQAALFVPAGADAVESLREAGVLTVVVSDLVAAEDGTLPGGVLVGLTVDRDRQLRAAVDAALDPAGPQVGLLRLADGVVGAEPGPASGATEALGRVLVVLDDAVTG